MAKRPMKGWPIHMIQKYAAARREIFYKRLLLERAGFWYSPECRSWLHVRGVQFTSKLFEILDFDATVNWLRKKGYISNAVNPNLKHEDSSVIEFPYGFTDDEATAKTS